MLQREKLFWRIIHIAKSNKTLYLGSNGQSVISSDVATTNPRGSPPIFLIFNDMDLVCNTSSIGDVDKKPILRFRLQLKK